MMVSLRLRVAALALALVLVVVLGNTYVAIDLREWAPLCTPGSSDFALAKIALPGSVLAKLPDVTVSLSLSVLSARGLREDLRHLIAGANYDFDDVFVVVDDPNPSNETIAQLEELKQEGLLRRWVKVDTSKKGVDAVYRSIFGPDLRAKHNLSDDVQLPIKSPYAKGQLSYMLEKEECRTDYCVHFDNDISVHTPHNFSWVQECILRLERYNDERDSISMPAHPVYNRLDQLIDPRKEVGFCHPAQGPRYNFTGGPKDWHHYYMDPLQRLVIGDVYSSRYTIFSRRMWNNMKPLEWSADHWESIVTKNLRSKGINTIALLYGAWAMHTKSRDQLANIRQCIEQGVFPESRIAEADSTEGLNPDTERWPICPPLDYQ